MERMDNFIWGDAHFTPYQYDKMANLPSGYLVAEDPMDTRDLYDTKAQLIISFTLFILLFVMTVGPVTLWGGDQAKPIFQGFLTVHQLEENMRSIRLENKRLEDELAALRGGSD